jgi:hypothetical protein
MGNSDGLIQGSLIFSFLNTHYNQIQKDKLLWQSCTARFIAASHEDERIYSSMLWKRH